LEQIIIVDENDNCLGLEEKGKCHEGDGILHRAFLAMVSTIKGNYCSLGGAIKEALARLLGWNGCKSFV